MSSLARWHLRWSGSWRPFVPRRTLARSYINAALKMKVEDLRPRNAGRTIRLHEKGGKHHAMPCHHALAEALHAYINAAGITEDRKGWLVRTSSGHKSNTLSARATDHSAAWRMTPRRAAATSINTPIGNPTMRATGITAYLANGGA